MPGSDDQYDQVHTYSQDHAGKSKTTKPAVRELGRDGAPVQLYVGEARDSASIRTPPTGVGYIFFDQSDDTFKQIDSAGTITSLAGGKSTEQVQDDVGSIMNEPLDYDDATPSYDISLSSALAVNGGNLDVAADGIVQSMIAANAVGNTQMADDAITPTEVDGSGGTDGQVLTSTGTEAQWESVTQNTPAWTEDGNSPFDVSGASSPTYTVSGSYDAVLVILDTENTSNTLGNQMRVNGDTSANYNYIDNSDTRTTGTSQFGLGVNGVGKFERFLFARIGGAGVSVNASFAGSNTGSLFAGENTNVTPPLDSFTIIDSGGGNFSLRARVYGLDV